MIRAAIILWMVMVIEAQSGPDRLSVLMGSHHEGGWGFETRTPGVFLTWEDIEGLDFSLGVYRNSYGRGSVAATAALPIRRWAFGEASVFLGAAWYPKDGRTFRVSLGDLVPVGGVQFRHRNWFWQIMPSDGQPVRAIFSVGLTFELHQ